MVLSQAKRYVVFSAAFMFQILTMGMCIGLSVLYAELIRVFHSERKETALIQGLFTGLTEVAGFLWTAVIGKIGIGYSIAFGVLLGTVGLLGSALAGSISTITVLTGVIGGIGYSVCNLGSFMTVNYAFENPEVPSTIVTIGSAFGQMVVPLFVEIVLEHYGWPGAFIFMAAMTIQCLPFAVIIHVLLERDNITSKEKQHFVCDQQLLRNIPFWILTVNMFLLSVAGEAEVFFIVDQVVDVGYRRSDGARMLIAMGCANLCGRIAGSVVQSRWKQYPTIYHWIYLYVLFVVCHVLVVKLTSYKALLAVCIIHGWSFGTVCSFIATVIYETVGRDRYNAALVVVCVGLGCGVVVHEIIGGLVRDYLGHYDVEYYIAIGVCLMCNVGNIVIAVFQSLERQRKVNESQLSSLKSVSNYLTME